MWIEGLEGLHFSAFDGNTGQRFFRFDWQSRGYEMVTGPDGRGFTPYGDVVSLFGRNLMGGQVTEADGSSLVGYEVYELGADGTLSLFADIRPGPDSSFFDFDWPIAFSAYPGVVLTDARYSSDTYEVTWLNGQGRSGLLSDLFDGIDLIKAPNPAVTYRGGEIVVASFEYPLRIPLRVDIETGAVTTLADFFADPGSLSFRSVFVAGEELYANVLTGRWGAELFRLGDGDVWEPVSVIGGQSPSPSPSRAFSLGGTDYFLANTSSAGRILHRMDPSGDLVPVPAQVEGLGLTLWSMAGFAVFGDHVYFSGNTRYGGAYGIYRMDADGTFAWAEDEFLALGGRDPEMKSLIGGEIYFRVTEDGEDGERRVLSKLGADGTVTRLGLDTPGDLGLRSSYGQIYANALGDDGAIHLWALTDAGIWQEVAAIGPGPATLRFNGFSQIETEGRSGDVYLGDGSAESVAMPEEGAVAYAGAGADTVEGAVGDDIVFGGLGRDRLSGGAGRDRLDGGAGRDRLHGGPDADTLLGGAEDDSLAGGSGADSLRGGTGRDTLSGGLGADLLDGGLEGDVLSGGAGRDTVVGGPGRDKAWLGAGADRFEDSVQSGPLGRDTVMGGPGDDVIVTRGGGDLLTGGAGADRFVFLPGAGRATVTDFDPGTDVIDLSGYGADLGRPDLEMRDTSAGAVLRPGGGDVVVLAGVRAGDLGAEDILFA
ncbi:calcium-binding protein [Mangrovicoccus sp. HB161399]|uniref:calcium-binding protein n=1 Tax=Mangrovicoccus sp. HB161399 TaxID=2720392 RepID=UPI0015580463|nr:calcium-binding protein [Mangrovicoccus sp. HB161399]